MTDSLLLGRYTANGVGGVSHDYTDYRLRQAVRAVLFDNQKIALVLVGRHDYYMLPGGGVHSHQSKQSALQREIMEEIGCSSEISTELGYTETYFDRWHNRQEDYGFLAKIGKLTYNRRLTTFENQEEHQVIWADNLKHAIALVANAKPDNLDGKLIQTRELVFLNAALAYRS